MDLQLKWVIQKWFWQKLKTFLFQPFLNPKAEKENAVGLKIINCQRIHRLFIKDRKNKMMHNECVINTFIKSFAWKKVYNKGKIVK